MKGLAGKRNRRRGEPNEWMRCADYPHHTPWFLLAFGLVIGFITAMSLIGGR